MVLPALYHAEALKFGTRVEQASNLCTNPQMCRFGYTFQGSSQGDSSTETPTTTRRTVKQQRQRSRLNFDPRRKGKKSVVVRTTTIEPIAEESAPVTIKIGGVPIVIPDFGVKNPGNNKVLSQGVQDQKKKIALNEEKSMSKSQRRKNQRKLQRNKNKAKNNKKVLKLFQSKTVKNSARTPVPRSRVKVATTTRPTVTTTPIIINTILDSFDELQQTISTPRITTSSPSESTETTEPALFTTLVTESSSREPKECPESLSKCVDACVSLTVRIL